jgi:hypothetical protein
VYATIDATRIFISKYNTTIFGALLACGYGCLTSDYKPNTTHLKCSGFQGTGLNNCLSVPVPNKSGSHNIVEKFLKQGGNPKQKQDSSAPRHFGTR